MRIARIASPTGPHHVVHDIDRWLEIADPFAAEPRLTGNEYPVGTVRMLAPVQPLVVLGMAHNEPGDRQLPRQALLMTQALVDDSTFNKIGYSAAPLQPGGAQSTT